MTTIAITSYLVLLTLVLLVGGTSYIVRGAAKRGIFLVALAAGLAATTAIEIFPALTLKDAENGDALVQAQLQALRSERDQLEAEVHQRDRDNEALARTSAFFNKLHSERLARIAEEIRNAKDILLGPGSGIVALKSAADTSVTSFVEGPNGFETLIAELRGFKTLKVRGPDDPGLPAITLAQHQRGARSDTTGVIVEPADIRTTRTEAATIASPPTAASAATPASAASSEAETLSALHNALDAKMATSAYRVEPMSDPDLVTGRLGRYYRIDLKSPKSGQLFTFDSGKYTLQGNKAEYRLAFQSFAGDVLKQLEGRTSFEIFVRGSADGQAYSGPFEPGFEFRRLAYLPGNGRGKYLANPASVALGNTVRNIDLPNLRGEFLRGYLAQLYPVKPATLLEGQVMKKDNPAARNTEIILFVAW